MAASSVPVHACDYQPITARPSKRTAPRVDDLHRSSEKRRKFSSDDIRGDADDVVLNIAIESIREERCFQERAAEAVAKAVSQKQKEYENELQRLTAASIKLKERRKIAKDQKKDLQQTHDKEIRSVREECSHLRAQLQKARFELQEHQQASDAREEQNQATIANLTSRLDIDMVDAGLQDLTEKKWNDLNEALHSTTNQLQWQENEDRRQAKEIEDLKKQLSQQGAAATFPQAYPSPPEAVKQDSSINLDTGSESMQTPTVQPFQKRKSNPLKDPAKSRPKVAKSSTGAGISKTKKNGVPQKGSKAPTRATYTSEMPKKKKERRADLLDGSLKAGSFEEFSTLTNSKSKGGDNLFRNEFYGKGFDRHEAKKIQQEWSTGIVDQSASESERHVEYWDDEGDMIYYLDRKDAKGKPLELQFGPEYFELQEEGDEANHILPLSEDLSIVEEGDEIKEQKRLQYAQACIIARLPEAQMDAARGDLTDEQLKSFEKRSFQGRRPIAKCHEEKEYPKMFKKVVDHLRSNWRFQRAARLWATGEPARNAISCWPPTFDNIDELCSTTHETEQAMERRVDERSEYKSDCRRADGELFKKAGKGLDIDGGQHASSLEESMGQSSSIDLDKARDGRVPSKKGLLSMFDVKQ